MPPILKHTIKQEEKFVQNNTGQPQTNMHNYSMYTATCMSIDKVKLAHYIGFFRYDV